MNEYIQAQLTGPTVDEIKTKEFYCYRICQRDITRKHGNYDKKEVNSRNECFDKLVQHVRQFSTVSKLSALLAKFQVERNIDVKGVLHKDIKRRLKQEFGDSLMFYYKSKRESEFVYHKSVDIEEDERSWFFLTVEEKVLKPLMPGGNKKVTDTSVQLQVCLSMCDLFVTTRH